MMSILKLDYCAVWCVSGIMFVFNGRSGIAGCRIWRERGRQRETHREIEDRKERE